MKATLTIEVPDDFEKGDCHLCHISPDGYCPIVLNAYNCPLEIQEKKDCTLEQDLTILELD